MIFSHNSKLLTVINDILLKMLKIKNIIFNNNNMKRIKIVRNGIDFYNIFLYSTKFNIIKFLKFK